MSMAVAGTQGFDPFRPISPRPAERQTAAPQVCRRDDVDCLKLEAAPKFKILQPMPWIEHQAATHAEPLNLDAKTLVRSVIAAPAVGLGVKVLSVGQEAYKIGRTTGLRTFAAQAGWKGSLRHLVTTFGKVTLRSYAAQGLVITGGVATAAVVHRVKQSQAKAQAAAGTVRP